MRAIVVEPPTPGARLVDVPEPERATGEVKVQVIECGVCGTDREIVLGQYGKAPPGRRQLILGHENLGRVVEVGPEVPGFAVGDLVVATVRRGCGVCRFCLANRSDFCETGLFTERGISGRDGYFTEFYTELPEYLVKVPEELRPRAVILEPLSVVEKAISEGTATMNRYEPTPGHPRLGPPHALVTGTGAIGLLAALLLVDKGFEVRAIDLHDDTPAARLLTGRGVHHTNVRPGLDRLGEERFHLIIEASGVAELDFQLLDYLAPNGVLVLTGIPHAETPDFPIPGGRILRGMVLENQALVGSVNANRSYFEQGRDHLISHAASWGPELDPLLLTRRPLEQYPDVLEEKGHAIKTVLTFHGASN